MSARPITTPPKTPGRGDPTPLAIAGATGRMGRAIAMLAREHGFELAGALAAPGESGSVRDPEGAGVEVTSDPRSAVERAVIVIDFSHVSAIPALAAACRRRAIPLVSGTTNLDDAAVRALDSLAEVAPVLWSPNMSVGVQVLADLVETAVAALGTEIDVEIVEAHHGKKVDAPSGTAKRLIDAVRTGRGGAGALVHGREGEVGARRAGEIGVHAIRGGDVVGDHTVMLLGQGERIELTHRATSRDVFAHGALRVARMLLGRDAGRYTMKSLFGR